MPGFGSPAVGTSGTEEAAGPEGVVPSNRLVAVTWADGDCEIVAAFGMVGAGAIAKASGVVISGGPGAVGLTGEGPARVPEGPAGGLSGAPSRQPRRTSSVSNCDIQGFVLITSWMDLGISALDGIGGRRRDLGTRASVVEPAASSSSCSKFCERSLPP